jgi:hypothetical protein
MAAEHRRHPDRMLLPHRLRADRLKPERAITITMGKRFIILVFILLVACSRSRPAVAAQPDELGSHLYVVVISVAIGTDSKIERFRVTKIIEPLTGANQAADVTLPKEYVEAARKQVEANV